MYIRRLDGHFHLQYVVNNEQPPKVWATNRAAACHERVSYPVWLREGSKRTFKKRDVEDISVHSKSAAVCNPRITVCTLEAVNVRFNNIETSSRVPRSPLEFNLQFEKNTSVLPSIQQDKLWSKKTVGTTRKGASKLNLRYWHIQPRCERHCSCLYNGAQPWKYIVRTNASVSLLTAQKLLCTLHGCKLLIP